MNKPWSVLVPLSLAEKVARKITNHTNVVKQKPKQTQIRFGTQSKNMALNDFMFERVTCLGED